MIHCLKHQFNFRRGVQTARKTDAWNGFGNKKLQGYREVGGEWERMVRREEGGRGMGGGEKGGRRATMSNHMISSIEDE